MEHSLIKLHKAFGKITILHPVIFLFQEQRALIPRKCCGRTPWVRQNLLVSSFQGKACNDDARQLRHFTAAFKHLARSASLLFQKQFCSTGLSLSFLTWNLDGIPCECLWILDSEGLPYFCQKGEKHEGAFLFPCHQLSVCDHQTLDTCELLWYMRICKKKRNKQTKDKQKPACVLTVKRWKDSKYLGVHSWKKVENNCLYMLCVHELIGL